MAWTTPRTWVAAEVVTASLMNTHIRDNLDVLRAGGLALSSQAAQDFIYASSATQLSRLAAVSGKIPRYNGSAWEMIKPIAAASATSVTSDTDTSGSYRDTTLTVSITTQTTTSKVAVFVSQRCQGANGDGQTIRLTRGSGPTELAIFHQKTYGSSDGGIIWEATCMYLDTPGAAAATTYKTQHLRHAGSGAGVIVQPSSQKSFILVAEIEVI